MRKIIYRIFGNPIVPNNTGLVGSTDGRLFIDKAVFFARKDVQAVIKSVKESTVIQNQIKSQKLNYQKMPYNLFLITIIAGYFIISHNGWV